MPVLAAVVWGAVAASSLIIGALLAITRRWSAGVIGAVLSFGAGALMASVAYSLFAEGFAESGALPVAIGLAAGAASFFFANRAVEAWGERSGGTAGLPLALGAVLDGIPEQAVLGIGLAAGEGVSFALLVAIFVSNLPEALGSANDMSETGRRREAILRLWLLVACICALASLFGYLLADAVSGDAKAAIDGFAAGALLVMLIDSMIPDARHDAGRAAGLVTVLGFAVAAGLSSLS